MNTKQKELYLELFGTDDDECIREAVTMKIKNMPKYFYKYCCVNDYTISNIIESSIYMSSPDDFNDPYDSAICNDFTGWLGDDLVYKGFFESLKKNILELRSETFISCFSERWTSMLMWSHYADFHRGICIQYDFSLKHRIKDDTIFLDIHPVVYSNNIYTISNERYNLQASVFVKAKDWMYEKEWRIIGHSKTKKPYIMKVTTPINSILLGCRISDYDRDTLCKLSTKLGFKIFQTKFAENTFKIIKLPI